jgi:predicted PurR-regulated permease PerM
MAEPAPARPSLFTPVQVRLVGFALAFLAVVVSGYLVIRIVDKVLGLVGLFSGVLWPLITAGILGLVLMPLVQLLERRLRLGRLASVITIFGSFIVVASGLAVAIIPPVAGQLIDFIAFLPTLWTNVVTYSQEHYPQWVSAAEGYLANPRIKDALDRLLHEAQGLTAYAVPSLRAAGSGVIQLFGVLASVAVIPIYLFFFLLSSGDPTRNLGEHLSFLRPGLRSDLVFLVREFVAIIVSFFRGQLIIGLIMGALLAIGFSVIGLRFGLFIGLLLGILNIVPYLGTIIGLAIALPLAFFQPEGGVQLVALALMVFVIVQNIEGWYLTPKIMGDRTGLHPVTIIFSIFFWGTALGGILGMILAIPLTAFFVTAWRLVKRKYLTTLTNPEEA